MASEGAGIDDHLPVLVAAVDRGVERVVPDVGDDDPVDGYIEVRQDVLMRSWVIGRGVGMFSMVRAMALASKTPIQMGRILSLSAIFEDDDGHFGDWIDHQSFDFHFDFHRALLLEVNIRAA